MQTKIDVQARQKKKTGSYLESGELPKIQRLPDRATVRKLGEAYLPNYIHYPPGGTKPQHDHPSNVTPIQVSGSLDLVEYPIQRGEEEPRNVYELEEEGLYQSR
jgi:hypothetical protein